MRVRVRMMVRVRVRVRIGRMRSGTGFLGWKLTFLRGLGFFWGVVGGGVMRGLGISNRLGFALESEFRVRVKKLRSLRFECWERNWEP